MSLTTVFTVCFGVAIVVGLVLFLFETQVALVLTLGGALAAWRGTTRSRRSWAIAVVACG